MTKIPKVYPKNYRGERGAQIEMYVATSISMLQSKYDTQTSWKDLLALSMLQGADGQEVMLRSTNDALQWKYQNDTTWQNLIYYSEFPSGGGVALQGSGTNIQGTGTIQFINANGISWNLTNGQMSMDHALQYTSATSNITSNAMNTTERGNYLGSAQSSNYRHTSADSQIQFTSANSLFQYTSASSLHLHTSQSSLFRHTSADSQLQFTSANTLFLGSNATQSFRHTSADSQLQFTSANSLFQYTSQNSLSLGTGATASMVMTSQSSLFQHTSATSNITSNAFHSTQTTKFAGTGTTFNGANLSASMTFNSVGLNLSMSAAAPGGGFAIKGSGTYTQNTGTVEMSAANGITFIADTNKISVTHALQYTSNTSAITSNALNSSETGSVYFSNTNGVTWSSTTGASATSIYVGSHAFAGTSLSTVSTTGSVLLGGINSAGISFSVPAWITSAGAGGVAIANSQTTYTSGTVIFRGTNLTVNTSAGGQYIDLSVAAPGAAAENNWINLQGNTASNTTASGSTIMWSAGNNVTLAATNGSVVRIDAGGGGGVAISASGSSVSGGTVVFSNSNSVSFGMNGSTVTASVPIGTVNFSDTNGMTWGSSTTTNGTTISLSSHAFAGTSLSTVSMTGSVLQGGVNSAGISLSVPAWLTTAGAGGVQTISKYFNNDLGASSTINVPVNTLYLFPLTLYSAVSVSTLMPAIISFSGTITSAATAQAGVTLQAGIYSQNTNSATRFDTLWTEGISMTFWNSGTSSYSYAISDSAGQSTGSSAGSNLGTRSVMGMRLFSLHPNQIFNTGQYLYGFRMSRSTAGYSAAMSRIAPVFNNAIGIGMGTIGDTTDASIGISSGMYSVTTANFPASINLSELRVNSNVVPYFEMGAV
jgi:hypothetical protein